MLDGLRTDFRLREAEKLKERFPWLGTEDSIDYRDECVKLAEYYAELRGEIVEQVTDPLCDECRHPLSEHAGEDEGAGCYHDMGDHRACICMGFSSVRHLQAAPQVAKQKPVT
jgi:hypothetical protein